MSDNLQATLTIQTKLAQDASLGKFIKEFPGQFAAIEKAAKAAGVSLDQVQASLATLGTKKNFLQMAAEGATFTAGEWTQLNSVIKKLGYDQLKIQADAALAAQKATKETKAQTDATKQLAQQTTNLGNAQKSANQQVAAKKGKTGTGLPVEQEKGINQVGRQLGQLEINAQEALAKQTQTILKGNIDAGVTLTREGSRHRVLIHQDENAKKRAEENKTLAQQKADERLAGDTRRLANSKTLADIKDTQKQAGEVRRAARAAELRDARAADAIIKRSLKGTLELQQQVNAAINAQGAAAARAAMMTKQGMTQTQAFVNQMMTGGLNQANAGYLAGGGAMPAGFPRAGGAGGGGWQKILGMLGFGGGGGMGGSLIRGALGATGIGAGFYGVAQLTQATVGATEAATAYDRMEVSARKLAGSQQQLNALLDSYQEAAGGAVDQATALENVMRLQATGFASSAKQVERFVRGARGAAISLGKPQDYVTQETQLAISNTSVKRLDQIGLGISEVDDRVSSLRETNKGMTREMAFQEAVIGLLNEKYGTLADSVEGQASGVEKLQTAWSDLGLEMGQFIQEGVDGAATWLAAWIEAFTGFIEAARDAGRPEFQLPAPAGAPGGPGGPPDGELDIFFRRTGGRPVGPTFENPVPPWMTSATPAANPLSAFFTENEDMFLRHEKAKAQIEADAQEAEDEALRDFVQSTTDVNNAYYKTLARDSEDYQRSRAKSEANYARQVADVREDAADREIEAAKDLMNQIVRMNRDAAREEARAQRDYNRSIERMNEDHAEGMQDLERDYRKRVEDIEEDHGRNIAEAREDSMERLQEMQTDYDDKITEARADSSKQLVEMEADYAKDRKRAFEQYQLSNLEAASNMDAKSLWMNQKRFELETKQAQEAHQDAIDKEGKRLSEFEQEAEQDHQKAISKEQKRLAEFEKEANEAHQRRLDQEKESYEERREQEEEALEKRKTQEAESFELRRSDAAEALKLQQDDLIQAHADQKRENDAADTKRLNDMKAAHLLEQGEAEADRLFRLGRMEVDHQAQLAEMGTQHTARIAQIGEQAQAERDKLEEEHEATIAELGYFIEGWALEHERLVNAAIKGFDDFMIAVEERLSGESAGLTPEERAEIDRLEGENVGYVATINDPHATGEERRWALEQKNANDRRISQIKRDAANRGDDGTVYSSSIQTGGKPVTNTGTLGGIVGGGTSVVIHPGAVQITAHPGMSISGLGDEFESRLLTVVKRLAGSNNL